MSPFSLVIESYLQSVLDVIGVTFCYSLLCVLVGRVKVQITIVARFTKSDVRQAGAGIVMVIQYLVL